MNNKIHILITDDHAIVLQGLRQIISTTDDLVVAGEADNGSAIIKLARECYWDVCLLDIAMPQRNGIDILKMLKKEHPRKQVLMLSMHPEDQYAVRAIQSGASGYITKQSAPAELVNAIRKVARGEKYISSALAGRLAEMVAGGNLPPLERLSTREYEVLRLMTSGRSLTQIASELNISIATVSTYRSRLLEKLCLANTAELIRYGLENGLSD